MDDFCATLEDLLCGLKADTFRVYRFDAHDRVSRPSPPDSCETLWIRAVDLAAAAQVVRELPPRNLILELECYSGAPDGLPGDTLEGRPITRVIVDDPGSLKRLLEGSAKYEVAALLTPEVADEVVTNLPQAPSRLVLAAANHDRLTDALARDADLPSFFQQYREPVPVENVPACISGRPPRSPLPALDARVLRSDGSVDVVGFTGWYIREAYTLKSRRCHACRRVGECAGAQVNFIRAHGFGVLRPERAPPPSPG